MSIQLPQPDSSGGFRAPGIVLGSGDGAESGNAPVVKFFGSKDDPRRKLAEVKDYPGPMAALIRALEQHDGHGGEIGHSSGPGNDGGAK